MIEEEGYMFRNMGMPGLILIIFLSLIIFGPKRLPEMGRAMGQTLREFKKSAQGMAEDVIEEIETIKEESKKEDVK
jgi:sec-independent protein translocase protein TatA